MTSDPLITEPELAALVASWPGASEAEVVALVRWAELVRIADAMLELILLGVLKVTGMGDGEPTVEEV